MKTKLALFCSFDVLLPLVLYKKHTNQGCILLVLYFNFTKCGRSYLFELINHFFELARERDEPAPMRLSLQAMRLSYFKNSDFTPSLRVSSLSKLFY